jgi:hypothetical protein
MTMARHLTPSQFRQLGREREQIPKGAAMIIETSKDATRFFRLVIQYVLLR